MIPWPNIKLVDVEHAACSFLKKYHPTLELPIPIEDIVERKMNIALSVVPGIKFLIGIDAFISSDFSQITIDEDAFVRYPERTRFSIAHEIGHMILHKEWYEKYGPKDLDEYLTSHDHRDERTYQYTEIQAQTFAGLMLVPKSLLFDEVEKRIGRIPKLESAEILAPVITDLPEIFRVSDAVVLRRLQNEGIVKLSY